MLKNFVKIFGGDPNKKTIEQYSGIAQEINSLEPQFEALSDEALRAQTDEFRKRISESVGDLEGLDDKEQFKFQQDALNEILPEVFAAVREAAKRTIGQRHYDVQMIGGIALHRGSIAEMRTGEGKTLVATLPIYLNALLGRGIHLITVNDYLARRDARWMAPIYHMLGLSVGVLQMAAATENGKKAFLVDFERESPHEDQRHLHLVDRRLRTPRPRLPSIGAALAAVWTGAALGTAVSLLWVRAPKRLMAVLYVLVGWVAVPALPALAARLGAGALALLFAGGLLYTAGAAIYAWRRPDPYPTVFGFHEIFHLLVVAAAACHFVVVGAAIRVLG